MMRLEARKHGAGYLGSTTQRLMVATLETALELALSNPAWREEDTRGQLGEDNKSWGGKEAYTIPLY